MILHFTDDRTRLNISFQNFEYNEDVDDGAEYLKISPDVMDALQELLDNDIHGNRTDIKAALLDAAIAKQTADANRDDLTDDEIINNRFL